MKTRFAFGKTGLDVSLPDEFNSTIVESKGVAPVPDVTSALSHALGQPLGCDPIVSWQKERGKSQSLSATLLALRPTASLFPRSSRGFIAQGSSAAELPFLLPPASIASPPSWKSTKSLDLKSQIPTGSSAMMHAETPGTAISEPRVAELQCSFTRISSLPTFA